MKPSVTIPEKNHNSTVHLVNPQSTAIPGPMYTKQTLTHDFIISNPNQPVTAPSRPLFAQLVSINSNNSVSSFGTDQTIIQGLKLTIHNLLNHSSHISPKQSVEQNTDCSWVSNPNISVSRFGTDQTVVQGLNQPKHLQSA